MNRLAKFLIGGVVGMQQIACKSSVKGEIDGIETFQYRANNPIQDRVCYSHLKRIQGVLTAVFDGHGGDLVAEYAAGNLAACVNARIQKNIKKYPNIPNMIETSLKESFDDVENGFLAIFKQNLADKKYQRVGACALAAIVTDSIIFVANAGDCEGVILGDSEPIKTNERLNAGEPSEQKRLRQSFPNEPDIYKCIQNTNYCYVKGRLQPTRSMGDFYLKDPEYNFTNLAIFTGPYITHEPKMTRFNVRPEHKTLVLASDGLWDELDEKQMHLIAKNLHESDSLTHKLFLASKQKIKKRNKMSWEELEKTDNRRDLHDDISIITIDLKKMAHLFDIRNYD